MKFQDLNWGPLACETDHCTIFKPESSQTSVVSQYSNLSKIDDKGF